ncbi:hypothetical protein BHM03_00058815 [Ensete ventricosum]|nr:hypothetical protein BHM03_00058815 [Ensete ventricosum]
MSESLGEDEVRDGMDEDTQEEEEGTRDQCMPSDVLVNAHPLEIGLEAHKLIISAREAACIRYPTRQQRLGSRRRWIGAKMVLAQLGGSIARALQQMSNATIIDEKVLSECLNEISRALLQSDVQFKLVRDMQANIKRIVNLDDLAAGHNKRRIIQQVVPQSIS